MSAPIIIIEDDLDDQEILTEAFQDIGMENRLVFFDNTAEAFDFLKATTEQPFLILSDVNMPGDNGIEFKRRIDSDAHLRRKSIPFVFFSTAVNKEEVDLAYRELTVQGFFKKSTEYSNLKHVLSVIMAYWKICKHPNT
jgi:CheY-like chemotaxis protein